MAPAVEYLLHAYPQYVTIDSLPLETVQERVSITWRCVCGGIGWTAWHNMFIYCTPQHITSRTLIITSFILSAWDLININIYWSLSTCVSIQNL